VQPAQMCPARMHTMRAMRQVSVGLSSTLLLTGTIVATANAVGRTLGSTHPSCPQRGPVHAQHNSWPPSQRKLAPRGARVINLCHYAGSNAHPSYKLVGNDLVMDRATKHQLISRFDALKPYHGRPLRCRKDYGEEVLATLFYAGGHEVAITVGLQGCEQVANGDINRLAINFDGNNPAGPRLVAQLKHLTGRRRP
jgi:hypothetical protein